MKEISEAIKKLTQDDVRDLAGRLQIQKKSKNNLIAALTDIRGLHALLGRFDSDTLRILKIVYDSPEGITFVGIQREARIDIQIIEKTADILSRNLLIYITKNRQMLTSKMDKAHGITEIAGILHLAEPKTMADRLRKNFLHLEVQKIDTAFEHAVKDREARNLLQYMAGAGCIVPLNAARDVLPPRTADRILSGLMAGNLVHLVHGFLPDFNSYLVLNEKIGPSAAQWAGLDDQGRRARVSNRYFMVQNLLQAFDAISTFGLFLTKQQEFRKIDLRRINDAMLPLKDLNGAELPAEESAQLAMFILCRLQCLKLRKDIAAISLAEIRNDIERPLAILKRVLKSIGSPGPSDPFFRPPFEIPSYDYCKSLIKLLHKMKDTTYRYLHITMLTRMLSEAGDESFTSAIMSVDTETDRFDTAMNLLCMAGVVDIDSGRVGLSDIGRGMANLMLKTYAAEEPPEPGKNIYLNPDFTLIIPAKEIPSETLYRIISHVDIVKNDFIIDAVISRASIVRAQKRGMSTQVFLDTLAANAKNEMPQNMSFLLREWSSQTISIGISQAIVMSTSHPGFIDELLSGIFKEGVIERLSPRHAIVKKEHLDDIVKFARKKDAVISLFSEIEDED